MLRLFGYVQPFHSFVFDDLAINDPAVFMLEELHLYGRRKRVAV